MGQTISGQLNGVLALDIMDGWNICVGNVRSYKYVTLITLVSMCSIVLRLFFFYFQARYLVGLALAC